ncbi:MULTISPECIES: Eco57I restriction-modification methylase domain-containing protein [Bacillus]|uniref:Eco57I restriction-modification methylase domain-containing protein n=1 Tax=Bacillus TaxID=1386 RepID=UPI000BEFD0C3|nr:TaqI-like C-terminal specificity domain-containing protein [Bacillus pseudomycoides]PEL25824.1 hypothetical protein CN608_13820 [Bacillus pseudomycoides]
MEIIEKSINHKLGAFYTPDLLSSYVAKRLLGFFLNDEDNNNKGIANITVLDPACGDGALLKAFENEINLRLNRIEDKIANIEESSKVFGIDVNPVACEESEENVSKIIRPDRFQSYLNLDTLTLMNKDLKLNNILPPKIKKFLEKEEGVDCIITNPPWGASINLSSEQLREAGYELAIGQYDSYELMIEISLKLLRENGYMALILPDSIFLHQHKLFREFLLRNTSIKLIYRLGEGFFSGVYRSTVILIIKKQSFTQDSEVSCLNLKKEHRRQILNNKATLLDIELECAHTVPQSRFIQDKEYRFDIDISNSEIELNLIEKIETPPLCWEYFESGRGIEISKFGNVQICKTCSAIFPLSKNGNGVCKKCGALNSLVDYKIIDKNKTSQTGWEPVLAGEDINRYALKNSRYINTTLEGYNYKYDRLKSNKPKLLIRKTGLGISASIDYDNRYTLQTVFHFTSKEEAPSYLNVEYVLGVLNSRVLLYYHLKKTGELEWKSHPYVTQTQLKELPVPFIDPDNDEGINIAYQITEKVRLILSEHPNSEEFIRLDLEIESLVLKLFGISREEYVIVNDTINRAEQLKSISALQVPKGFKIEIF